MTDNTPLPIANGYYLSDSPVVSAQQCINWYPNIVDTPALSQETLFGTAGITQAATTGVLNQQNRGALEMNGIAYFVNGANLYRFNSDETAVAIGAITGTGRVSMATNGTQLFILVPGGLGSVWVEDTSTFTPDVNAVDSDFTANGNPQHVAFVDGYFMFTTDTKKFIVSALNDGLAYNALDFGTAEADPDSIVSLVVYQNQPYIVGTKTIEGFENVGGSGFPFQRNGLFIEKGLFAAFSLVKGDQAFKFVGGGENEGPGIYEFRGNSVVKISNTAIDSVLQDLTSTQLADIYALHYGLNGQFFTSFVLAGECFEYNAASQRWNQRRSFIGGAQDAWRVSSAVTAYGKIYVGDRLDGRIGVLDEDVYTEYGATISRILDTMPFAANGNSFSISSLELTTESGVGNGAVTDPQIRMRRSLDGGKTFKDETTRSLGKVGEYERRAIWRRQGRASRFEMFRFTMTDAVKPAIVKLQARFRAGTR